MRKSWLSETKTFQKVISRYILHLWAVFLRKRAKMTEEKRKWGREVITGEICPAFFLSAKLKCPTPQDDNLPRKPSFISNIELKSLCFSEDLILVSQTALSHIFKISAKISRTQNQKLRWDFPVCLPLTSSEMSVFNFPKRLMQPGVFGRLQWQGALQKNISISLPS